MNRRRAIFCTITVAAALAAASIGAYAADAKKYPDWEGQWERIGSGSFDPSKPPGHGQDPPLTAEYQAVWEANLKENRAGGQAYNPQARCIPSGMPRMMIAYQPLELIVTPAITYVAVSGRNEFRRIYTDGRDWPINAPQSLSGYSIGRWLDEDGDGRYDVLEVETRDLKGPRIIDAEGIPVHKDNQTLVKERIGLDRANADVLRDEITTLDHALTRPWTVIRTYRRLRDPTWVEDFCGEDNRWVFIGGESYMKGPDGQLMPAKKDQKPPDLRFFNQARQ